MKNCRTLRVPRPKALGVAMALGLDRWRGRIPAGANLAVLVSFVLPEILVAVSLLFVATVLSTPLQLGTSGQVIGLVTYQLAYPVVIVRSRLLTIGRDYEEAAIDLTLTAEYGKSIPQLAEAVRRNVANRVESLVGLRVTEVNITVSNIFFPQQEAEQERQQQLEQQRREQEAQEQQRVQ